MYLAFRSGSINNLMWVALGEVEPSGYNSEAHDLPPEMAKTDVRSLNAFMQFMIAKLSRLGEGGGPLGR